MTLANKITISRMALLPFFVLAVVFARKGWGFVFAALLIFICIAVSDFLDGYFARKRNERTKLGTLLDPIADKLTMVTAVVLLGTSLWPEFSRLMVLTVVVVIGRDVLIICGGLVLKRNYKGNLVLPPTWSGKISTASQLVLIPFVLLFQFLYEVIPTEPGGLSGLQITLRCEQWWVIAWVAISLADYTRIGVRLFRQGAQQ